MKTYYCPECSKKTAIRIDEENVRCKKCGCKTDLYESLKHGDFLIKGDKMKKKTLELEGVKVAIKLKYGGQEYGLQDFTDQKYKIKNYQGIFRVTEKEMVSEMANNLIKRLFKLKREREKMFRKYGKVL